MEETKNNDQGLVSRAFGAIKSIFSTGSGRNDSQDARQGIGSSSIVEHVEDSVHYDREYEQSSFDDTQFPN